ncbi:ABC transporter substrate-binding protein [Ornatilinea apprima]|uniref:ABC transporter substrate-binding protein n=1 Tax=Ornatilinea apprima TaxID=1134406 RepID=UPI001364A5D6|nr:extracellular solute-binding protein [Ornatilinea apprima]
MKKSFRVLISVLVMGAFLLSACAPKALPTEEPASEPPAAQAEAASEAEPASSTGEQNVTLEFWTFSDYASDVGGDLMKTFIAEFEAAHPGVKINMTGKGGDELNTGIVTSAASGTIPDVYMGTTSQGALFTSINAMENVYDNWMAMPEEYRSQFNEEMIKEVMPGDNEMYALPFTGYSTFLYRNLTVLRAAGIDPDEPIETWDEWLAQMEQIYNAGYLGMGSFYNDWWDFTNIYSGAATPEEWGIDFQNETTLINPEKYIQTVEFLEAAKPYGTENGDQDQATTDLFLSNKLAFIVTGPWMDPTFKAAKENGSLDYDYVLIPGATPDNKGGVRGTEFIGFSPNSENFDLAWEFATYICDEPQLLRWGETLGRFNSNNAAIAKVTNPLLSITYDAAVSSLFERPPHFTEAYPGNYYQVLQDNLAQITTGVFTPEEGAADLIEQLNDTIVNR